METAIMINKSCARGAGWLSHATPQYRFFNKNAFRTILRIEMDLDDYIFTGLPVQLNKSTTVTISSHELIHNSKHLKNKLITDIKVMQILKLRKTHPLWDGDWVPNNIQLPSQ